MAQQKKQIYEKAEAGKRIRRRREQLGFSRHDMAERIGKAEKYYADIERGCCGMSLDTMIKIAECLGMTLDYLVFGEEPETDGTVPREAERILFYLENCNESKQKKAIKLLEAYLSD